MNTIKLNTIGDSPVVVKKGSQVQSQEKTVEITENGTTEVVPDAGYALQKVTVNTNVQGGGESSLEYLDVSEIDINDNPQFINIVTTASLVYLSDYTAFGQTFNGVITYGQFGFLGADSQYIKALAIDLNADILNMQTMSGYVTIKEYFRRINIEELYNSLPRITKEQFYNLEA